MKKNVLKIMCAVLALAMFVGICPQTSVSAAAALKAPKALKAVTLQGAIGLMWSEVKGAKSYVVYRSVNDGKFKKVDTVSETLYDEEETFAEGTKLTYCVTAKNKNGESEKSKTAKITFTTKDKYKKVRKAFAKYAKKNGSESPKGTYNLVSLDVTGSTSILGASYVENQDSVGFTYIGGDDNTFYTIILTYTPSTDPCIVYSGFDADSNMTGTAMIFINPAKVTKKTKFTKNDAFVIEDESDGAVDHIAIINEGVQEIFAYAKKDTSKIDGVSMKKLGFKNYK